MYHKHINNSVAMVAGNIICRLTQLYTHLWACGLQDGGVSIVRGPSDALHHMFVLPQLGFALFGGDNPDTHRLVVRAAGNQRAVLVWTHHPHPLPVAGERLHTVPVDGNISM